jgi:hypothetical protein
MRPGRAADVTQSFVRLTLRRGVWGAEPPSLGISVVQFVRLDGLFILSEETMGYLSSRQATLSFQKCI